MTARRLLQQVRRRAAKLGLDVSETPGKGSHRKIRVGACQTSVPFHAGEDLGAGIRRAIERDLEPCLGPRWLTGG